MPLTPAASSAPPDEAAEDALDPRSKIGAMVCRMCDYCDKKGVGPRKLAMCNSCHSAWYCDAICQRSDWGQHKVACKAANLKETQKLLDTGTFSDQLGRWARLIDPEVDAFLNVPHFPELSGTGTRAPLTIQIHTTFHPDETDPRRRFKIVGGGRATKTSYVDWGIRKGYLSASQAVKKAEAWEDYPSPARRLLFTSVKVTESSQTSPRFCQVASIGTPERLSLSAVDPTNEDLEWTLGLTAMLWEQKKCKSIVELEGRVAVAFLAYRDWMERAVEVMEGFTPKDIRGLDKIDPVTRKIIVEGLGRCGIVGAKAEKHALSIAHYSRYGGGIIGEFAPAPYAMPSFRSPTAFLTHALAVLYSWKNSPVLRKDPLAKKFFASLTTNTLPLLLGGAPFSLIYGALRSSIATNPNKPPELFLTAAQCSLIKAKLSETMGPTRTKQSWKQDADIPPRKMAHATVVVFGTPGGGTMRAVADLEGKLEELKVLEDQLGTGDSASRLELARRAWEDAKRPWKGATFFAIDVETWEHDHDVLTEFGWSLVEWKNGSEVERSVEHIVIKENAHRRNGRYCPDARDHFDFGSTRVIPEETLLTTLTSLFASSATSPLYLIMHDPRSDLVALQLLGISTSSFFPVIPNTPPLKGIYIIDSQDLYCGLVREKGKRRLEVCAEKLGVKTRRLHNAANDAKYTLDVFEKMMERDCVVLP